MATVTKGRTFVSGEVVTPTKLNTLVDGATVSNIQTADISDGVITTAKIADGAITSAKIADAAIATGDIADGAITSAKIADATIATGDIANGAVTPGKLSTGAPTWDTSGNLATQRNIFVGRQNTTSEGGQIEFSKAIDNTTAYYLDVVGAGASDNKFRLVDLQATAERIVVDHDGNVGVGISTPAAKLDVAGQIRGSQITINADQINNHQTTASGGTGSIAVNYAGPNQGTTEFRDFHVWDGKNNQLLIVKGSTGNVGIGTASPASKLDVTGGNIQVKAGTQYGGIALKDNNNNTTGYIIGTSATNDNGQIGLLAAGAQRVTINSSGDSYFNGGNVGIGTSNPLTKLQVAGAIVATNAYAQVISDSSKATSQAGSNGAIIVSSNDSSNPMQGYITLVTDPTASNRRLKLSSVEQNVAHRNITLAEDGGNVGIGTALPAQKLDVNGAILSANLLLQGDGTDGYIRPRNASSRLFLGSNDTNHLVVSADGKIGIGTTTPQVNLDIQNGPSECQIRLGPNSSAGYIFGNSTAHGFYSSTGASIQLGRQSSYVDITATQIALNGSVSAISCPNTAKAWVIFEGNASPYQRFASYNVTSVTQIASSNFWVNFTTAFSNTNYATVVSMSTSTTPNVANGIPVLGARETTRVQVRAIVATTANNPSSAAEQISVVVFA
jgi:hypothetical protein